MNTLPAAPDPAGGTPHDEATTLTTNVAMRIGDVSLPAGDYTLYVDPRQERVQLLFSSDVGVFHTVYDSQRVIGRADMTLMALGHPLEGLTFSVTSSGDDGGFIGMGWDDRQYNVPVAVRR